jgi:molybdopterin/thiamine biosynthesis adenylyltransferase
MLQPENHATVANLTEEEATRYDRQMRLWGIEAQQRYIFSSTALRKNHI